MPQVNATPPSHLIGNCQVEAACAQAHDGSRHHHTCGGYAAHEVKAAGGLDAGVT